MIAGAGIHHVLLRKTMCPKCASSKYKLEDLSPNLSLRQNVTHFLESQFLMGDSDNNHEAPGRKLYVCVLFIIGSGVQ